MSLTTTPRPGDLPATGHPPTRVAPAGARPLPVLADLRPAGGAVRPRRRHRAVGQRRNRYLDFLVGLAVVALGHAHPEVADALAEQAGTLLHVSNLFATEPGAEVAVTLDRLLGGGGQVFFCNSGAEANEAAIKLARKWGGHGRYVVVSAYGSFHGRTLATLHATGQPSQARGVPAPARGVPPRGLERPRRARRPPSTDASPPSCSSRCRARAG